MTSSLCFKRGAAHNGAVHHGFKHRGIGARVLILAERDVSQPLTESRLVGELFCEARTIERIAAGGIGDIADDIGVVFMTFSMVNRGMMMNRRPIVLLNLS